MGPPITTSVPESSSLSSSGLRWKQQQQQKWMRLLVTTILLLFNNGSGSDRVRGCCHAKKRDRHAPHPHRGELTPYSPGPFALRLTADDEAKLARGDAIMKQILPNTAKDAAAPSTQQQQQQGGSAGSAICVQDVHAPIEAVWNQILDLNNYPNKVGKVQECRNYLVRKHNDGRVTIKTKQVLGVLPGYSVS